MIPVNIPSFQGKEKEYLQECIHSGWISSEGPFVGLFESKIAQITGRRFGTAVSSGTAALEIAIKALNIGPGDEVILPSFSIISCAASVIKSGATPVLVDCDPHTFNLIPQELEAKITQRTKAVMVVHTYGLPCDMDPVLKIAKQHGLKIIEDAAEVLGQKYKNQMCGSFGDISIFSFYANKIVSCGEGGMLMSDDEALTERCRSLRNLCFIPGRRFVHEELGWNYRMTNLQAAVGLAQAEQLQENVAKKRAIGVKYQKELATIPGIRLPVTSTDFAENIYWVFPIVLEGSSNRSGEEVITGLKHLGVDARPFFWPVHLQPVFLKMGLFSAEEYPNSEMLAKRGFYIPSGVGLTDGNVKTVCHALETILK